MPSPTGWRGSPSPAGCTRNPDLAAEQFLALLTGPMEMRSRLGTRQVPDDELRAVTQTTVEAFLHLYAPRYLFRGS
jgi:TetR/AcrR family transcriptional repressor of mexJK operon